MLLPVGNFCKLREHFATYELVFLFLAFLTYTFIAMIEHRFFNGPSQILVWVQLNQSQRPLGYQCSFVVET